jgi:predicted esterase
MRSVLITLLIVASANAATFERGTIVERLPTVADPAVSYAYYLPKDYTIDRKWPVLFVFDPRQRGAFAADLFRDAAEEFGWIIVSSNDTRSDGPVEPNFKALNGMWPDVNQRFAVDRRRIYATGFSGGAILAWWLAEGTGSVAGVISVGGRVNAPEKINDVSFAWFGIAGDKDFNYIETRDIEERLATSGARRRFESFDGRHRWAPKLLLRKGIEWMEIGAMRSGTRDVDAAIVSRAFDDDMAQALSSSDELEALDRYESIVRSFEGLIDVSAALDRIAALRRSPALDRVKKDEREATRLERAHRARLPQILNRFLSDPEVQPAPMIAQELMIPRLQQIARQKSRTGLAAQRVLESIFVQFNFYLPQTLTGPKLSVSRAVAKIIRPEAK